MPCDALSIRAADKIHHVMVRIAAHEHEPVVDPVGDFETEDLLVEIRGLLRIVHHPGNVAELERPDAVMRQMLAEIVPSPGTARCQSRCCRETSAPVPCRDGIVA